MATKERSFTTFNRLVDHLEQTSSFVTRQTLVERLIDSVSDAMIQIIGSDLHFETGIVEKHKHIREGRIFLNRNPITEITQIRDIDLEGNVSRTYESTEFTISDPSVSMVTSSSFPDTRVFQQTGTAWRHTGPPLPLIEVTYTGGWRTPNQLDASNPVPTQPGDLEDACITQVVHQLTRMGRDQSITSISSPDSSINYEYGSTMLLKKVREVARKYKRAS